WLALNTSIGNDGFVVRALRDLRELGFRRRKRHREVQTAAATGIPGEHRRSWKRGIAVKLVNRAVIHRQIVAGNVVCLKGSRVNARRPNRLAKAVLIKVDFVRTAWIQRNHRQHCRHSRWTLPFGVGSRDEIYDAKCRRKE